MLGANQAALLGGSAGSLENGLVAWYPFSGNANDASANGNNGTVNGATLCPDRFGVTDRAYSFNGVSNYITATSIPINASITVSLWVKSLTSNWSENGFIASSRSANGFIVHPVKDTKNINFYILDTGANLRSIATATPTSIDVYHHYAMVFDNSTGNYSVFVDGASIASSNITITRGSSSIDLSIGRDMTSRYGKAEIDDVRIYNRALSVADIQQLYGS